MTLSWNEIKSRAIEFSKEWENDFNEHAEAKSFMDAFFNVFGISRKRVGTFEQAVKKEDGRQGFIDFLWKGVILIEFKSRGKNLEKAHSQAKDYFAGIKESDLPKYILVCDFERFRLYDLEEIAISNEVNSQHNDANQQRGDANQQRRDANQQRRDANQQRRDAMHRVSTTPTTPTQPVIEFKLADLVHNVQHFGYLLGYQKKVYKEQDPANIKAAELMGKLHDRLEEIGYTGHPLEVYLVRILFCLFAEDTTIFNKQQFQDYIEQRTSEDGSDLAPKLQELFQVLNTNKPFRFKNLDEQLAEFPYVNGKLFEEILPTASFDSKMRQSLLDCCYLDWSKISPAIFGSMFQSVMNPKERRNLGAHYTSETNILKLIKPLFLDDLWKEFESVKNNRKQLQEFHEKLSRLKFLDPACGCGNFLVITYRELRLLEIEILRALRKTGQAVLNVSDIIWLDVDMMHGIEFEEFPARIAEVAMWLIDHQMNMQISNEFGQYFVRLPLKKSAKIIHGNALQIDWRDLLNDNTGGNATVRERVNVDESDKLFEITGGNATVRERVDGDALDTLVHTRVSANDFSYILGNPPFIGHQWRNQEQMKDMELVFGDAKRAGRLDYVTAWYKKAAEYIQNTNIKVAFVSTNSIAQGEQAGILWNSLFNQYNIKIHFAHRSFSWSNEARGNAGVHVVIVGFGNFDIPEKRLFEYENIKGEPHEIRVKNINSYLTEGKEILIESRRKPIHSFPAMFKGSQPTDGGHLIINSKEEFVRIEPQSKKFIKRYMGAEDFLDSKLRWCLWLKNADPKELKALTNVIDRLLKVKESRLKSPTPSVRKFAEYPSLFTQDRQPETDYLVIPEVSSENRKYIPIGFESKDVICANTVQIIPNANFYIFGFMQSLMHMIWARTISGRLESRIRYTPAVYNNFPFPENPNEKQIKAIETAAQRVLDARAEFPNSSLADLYDPLTMPPSLVKAHNNLDRAVDLAYRPNAFTSEANRMVFLFELYEKYTAGLFTEAKPKKVRKTNE